MIQNNTVLAISNSKHIQEIKDEALDYTNLWPYHLSPQYFKKFNETDILALMDYATAPVTVDSKQTTFWANFILGEYHMMKGVYKLSDGYFERAIDITDNDTETGTLLLKRATCYLGLENYIKALEFLRQAKLLENMTPHQQAVVHLMESYAFVNLGSYRAALKRLQLIKKYQKDTASYLLSTCMSIEGFIYQLNNNYSQALESYSLSNQYLISDSIQITSLFNLVQVAKINRMQKRFDVALKGFKNASEIAVYFGNENIQARILLEIGEVYVLQNKQKQALQKFSKAKAIFNRLDNAYGAYNADLKLLDCYINSMQVDSANYVARRLKKMGSIFPQKQFEQQFMLAKYYRLTGNLILAEQYANKALEHVRANDIDAEIKVYAFLSNLYIQKNAFKQAYEYKDKSATLNDSLNHLLFSFNVQLKSQTIESQFQEKLIQQLKAENNQQNFTINKNLKQIEVQKSKLQLILFILLLTIALLIVFLLWLRSNRLANKRLSLINKTIAQQKEEIELQSQHLLKVNEELNKLSIIASETDNAIKVLHATGKIVWINEGYTKMYGYTLNELQNIDGYQLIGEEANIDINKLVSIWYGDKKPISFESLNKTKSGQKIWTQTTITPILDDNGKVAQMVAIDSDITQQKTVERELTVKNEDITASISYAKRIQQAMITPFEIIQNNFPNSFYYEKPKAIVSGDFYWTTIKNNRLVVVCADCTGHGVPGAFMSLLGMSFLNKIVNEKGFTAPAVILNRLRLNVINLLNQKNNTNAAGDGMDVSVVSINLNTNNMQFAGAMNASYLYRKSEFIELKADRMPVGFFDNEERPFSNHSLQLEKNDQLFMFTDGFSDQFGGEQGSKLKITRFKEILKSVADKSFNLRVATLDEKFNAWKNDYAQVDDILILGIEILNN